MKFAKNHFFAEIYLTKPKILTIFANIIVAILLYWRKVQKKTKEHGKPIKKNRISGATVCAGKKKSARTLFISRFGSRNTVYQYRCRIPAYQGK
jgi:hypothetical protein